MELYDVNRQSFVDSIDSPVLPLPPNEKPPPPPNHILALGPERAGAMEAIFEPEMSMVEESTRWQSDSPETEQYRRILLASDIKQGVTVETGIFEKSRRPAGLVQVAQTSIFSCPPILQKSICERIIVGGGLWNVRGVWQRFKEEMRSYLPSDWRGSRIYRLKDKPENSAWLGGAVWASDFLDQYAIRREDYFEKRR